jgi:hypothetical protein
LGGEHELVQGHYCQGNYYQGQLFSVRRYLRREWRSAHRPRWRRHSRTIAAPTDRGSLSDFSNEERSHLQIDGRAMTLAKRLALSGSRYSGDDVTLKIGRGQHA